MKALILDIETSPKVAVTFLTKDVNLAPENIIQDKYIMCFSAKWLGDPPNRIIYHETRTGNDKPLLKVLWNLLNEAEVVITQNGESFDEPEIQARMMLHGMKPYKPVKHHDTYRQNKKKRFTFHKLEYLSEKLCTVYKKLKHSLFPGLALWKACLGIKITLNPNPKAWAEMKKYNIHDVLSTEELYLKTRGWSTTKAPMVYANRNCATCGSDNVQSRGHERTVKAVYRRLQCQDCGKWTRGEKIK